MKKYIIFFVSIGLLLGIVLFYSTLNVEQSKKVTFSEAGYILDNSTERHYFYEDETYTTAYNDKITFYDTEGEKVTLSNKNFIHYSSGNIVGLQKGVLLDLNKINDNPIIYYNINANQEIKRVTKRYTVKNLDKDLQFEQAIWKISSNKYIILGNNIKIKLENGTEKDVEGYVEIEYSDNEIINIYTQEFTYQTISSDSYIELDDDIKINLGTKIVSKKDKNKMSLEDMVIDSDDNVTLIDLNNNEKENTTEENTTENEVEGNSTVTQSNSSSSSNSSTTSNSQSTVVNQGNTGTGNETENSIQIETSEIQYNKDQTESSIDLSKTLAEPKIKIENMKVTALSIKGNIKITDDNDLLSKDDDVLIKIINNSTGKTVYNESIEYGVLNIPLEVETLLPNTQYTIIVSATYLLNETAYTKNFVYKAFVTSKIGIDIDKNGYTDNSLNFSINFSDELIKGAKITLLDENENELESKNITNINNESVEIEFNSLNANTQYKLKISNIQYNGATQTGSNWVIYYEDCKTLKSKASIDKLNYSIDKRNSSFKLYIDKVTDKDETIINYTYNIYEYLVVTNSEGKTTLKLDDDNIVYTRTTTDKEITVEVGNAGNVEGIVREKYYCFQVIANTYDNEKYVEVASEKCGVFILSGKSFPTVKFTEKAVTATKIEGTLYISDPDNTVIINNENQLSVMYKNNIGDEKTFITIKDENNISIETDENGEKVIAIPIKLEELRANSSYVLSAYGSVNLDDGNDVYNNIYIGSAIVTTNSYKELEATIKQISEKTSAFAINVNLNGEEYEKESLESITFIMQEGSDFNPNDDYKSLTINNLNCNGYTDKTVKNLKELICDNNLKLTPSMIGGGKESDYKALNYVILATITVDGTKYKNKIPICAKEDENNKAGTTTFTNNNEVYTAVYILIDSEGTTATIPEGEQFNIDVITNEMAKSDYTDLYNSKLNDSTVVGYEIKAKFSNNGTKSANSITYYVWDKNGLPVYDGNGNQLTYTHTITNGIPSQIVPVNYGTTGNLKQDNETGLHRGGGYYFTYTVTYIDEKGNKEIWPTMIEPEMDETSLKSDEQYPNKQEPNFVMYPKTSDENSMTYIYSCYDYDKALNYKREKESSLELNASNTTQGDYNIEIGVGKKEVKFENLDKNTTYEIRYKRLLNKAKSSTYVAKTLISQKFEGIVELGNITYTVSYNNENSPNKLTIDFSGKTADLEKVAGAKVTLSLGENKLSTNLLEINYDEKNKKYYMEADILSLALPGNVINKDIDVQVSLYYDNGQIGYLPGDDIEYSTYVNTSENYWYMCMDENGNFVKPSKSSINGNAYKYKLNTEDNDEIAYLTIQNMQGITKILELKYTGSGFMYEDNIIVQKSVIEKKIDTENEHKIKIDTVIVGITVSSIETTITESTIKAELVNPLNLNIKDGNIYVELIKLQNKNETINWNDAETREISLENIGEFNLNNLDPAYYYKIRFKYILDGSTEYTYMYDTVTHEIGKIYDFETLATIDIDNVNIEYNATNYNEKYLNITYNVNSKKSNMYEKTKYEFYEYNNDNPIELTNDNIWVNIDSGNTYEIVNGALYVTNSVYNTDATFDNVLEKINISPKNNVFTFGNKYKLVITPIVYKGETEIDLEDNRTEFELKELNNPEVGIKMLRKESDEQKYIVVAVSVEDNDKVMAGEISGEYTLKAYKYKDESAKTEINISQKDGTDIIGKTFNLNEHSGNYSVYIQNCDFSYNYEIVMQYRTDIQNNNVLKDKMETRTIQSIDKEIDLGTIGLNKIEDQIYMIFYDSYKVTDMNYIKYTIRDNKYGKESSGDMKLSTEDWEMVEEDELTIRYQLPLQFEINFSNNETYTIMFNFYKKEGGNESLVGTKSIYYTQN